MNEREEGKGGGGSADREEETAETTTLEERLRRLEQILGQLESDEVELERALALFEEGVSLVRGAEKVLSDTQLRVEELLAGGRKAPFDEADEEDEAGEGRGA